MFIKGVNSALTTYFFGSNMNEKLTIEKFLDFQQQLQKEILSLEVNFAETFSEGKKYCLRINKNDLLQFERRNPDENGRISEVDFTELLLAYAGYPDKKKTKIIKTVKKR